MVLSADSIRVVHPLFQEEGDGSQPISALQLTLREIEPRKAQHLNALWHSVLPDTHLGNLVGNSHNVFYGAEYLRRWYAVAIWTSPIAANRMTDGGATIELRRFAIASDAPPCTASRLLAVMSRLIQRKFPELKRMVSYQAKDHHRGTIYRAAGWVAAAESKSQIWHPSESRAAFQTSSDKVRWEKTLR